MRLKIVQLLSVCFICTMAPLLPAHAEDIARYVNYPNQGRSISTTVSSQWFLLETERPGQTILKQLSQAGWSAPRAERLQPRRLAVQITTHPEVNGTVRQALMKTLDVSRVWPAYERFGGVGFFDDRVVFRADRPLTNSEQKRAGLTEVTASPLAGIWAASASDGDGISAAWRLIESGLTEWAEPDLIRHVATQGFLNDKQLDDQWHLENSDNVGDINAASAWRFTVGDPNITIAIVDNGTELTHPDLAPNIIGGHDAVDGDNDPSPPCIRSFDGAGPAASCEADRPFRASHGTAVAGVAAARGGNKKLGSGVCPECTLYPVRLLGDEGTRALSTATSFRQIADAGVAVINNSWGPSLTRYFPLSSAEREVFDDISVHGRDGLGVVIIFASGNEQLTPAVANPYASHPGVIAVSASSRRPCSSWCD